MAMPIELIVLDVDGTLAEPGKPVDEDISEKLRKLEAQGARIVFASGKNVAYLSGLARGIGIKFPLLIGENGCVVLDPIEMWEVQLAERHSAISQIEQNIRARFGEAVWIQPNQIEFTIFPRSESSFPEILSYVRELMRALTGQVVVLEHQDAIDVLPVGIDKGKALQELKRVYGFRAEKVIAIGDAENDLSMAREVKHFFLVGDKAVSREVGQRFATLNEILVQIENLAGTAGKRGSP